MGYENLKPDVLEKEGRFCSFNNGQVIGDKKKNKLPAMGWNSWNAFGSGNTEALTKAMADKFIELGLNKLGYEYIILDDGCYKSERVNDELSNEEIKFPSGFKALSDYIHGKGLKYGMYNDIGTNLCAGAQVGTCGHEDIDAKSYVDWGVDFLKVDNCYYPFDNATFSNPENARYTFAPNIRAVKVLASGIDTVLCASKDGTITGSRAQIKDDYVSGIGTFDGTGPDHTPVGLQSSELVFEVDSLKEDNCSISLEYATGKEEGVGEWLQLDVNGEIIFDGFVKETADASSFIWCDGFAAKLKEGKNIIRIMNHRRQENTLNSYARLLKELKKIAPEKDIYYSACEWGKTQPHNWGPKVCDSWRILNDITFRVGSDGDPGHGDWTSDYTTSVTVQYNKAVIMDEFAGLSKGWNDPDMLMVGMDGLSETQCKTHMAMWCMMNSPLMLGLDLRRVEKGDWIYNIITNTELISINQDKLGVQAKRVYSSLATSDPSTEYIRDIDRVDILVKPLCENRMAISFINVSQNAKTESYSISMEDIIKAFEKSDSLSYIKDMENAGCFEVKDIYTGKVQENTTGTFTVDALEACDNMTYIVSIK
jgi:alpha-galactosidase